GGGGRRRGEADHPAAPEALGLPPLGGVSGGRGGLFRLVREPRRAAERLSPSYDHHDDHHVPAWRVRDGPGTCPRCRAPVGVSGAGVGSLPLHSPGDLRGPHCCRGSADAEGDSRDRPPTFPVATRHLTCPTPQVLISGKRRVATADGPP